VHAGAAIMRAAVNRDDAPGAEQGWLDWLTENGIPAITDLDTRALVRHIRDLGAMRGGVFPDGVSEAEAQELIAAEPSMSGRDLAREVTPREVVVIEGSGPRIAMIDTGVKRSIVNNLAARGATLELHPCTASPQDLLENGPDAIFLANGPGDPAALGYIVETVRELVGKRPVYGICLGHQLLCRAVGLETYKLPFGHHGANHPVRRMSTGVVEITSQNHNYAVEPDSIAAGADVTHVNLNDGVVEGLRIESLRAFSVQYHPEAAPGPHDAAYLFDDFTALMEASR
jgi:carbamoyl-phosphate synthase small subunit